MLCSDKEYVSYTKIPYDRLKREAIKDIKEYIHAQKMIAQGSSASRFRINTHTAEYMKSLKRELAYMWQKPNSVVTILKIEPIGFEDEDQYFRVHYVDRFGNDGTKIFDTDNHDDIKCATWSETLVPEEY